jgi:hypothetical protein
MPQKPDNEDQRAASPIPQEQDDDLEMAEDDDEFEDDEEEFDEEEVGTDEDEDVED